MASMPAVTARLGPKTLKFQTIVWDSAGAENRAPANTLAMNAYGPRLIADPPCSAPLSALGRQYGQIRIAAQPRRRGLTGVRRRAGRRLRRPRRIIENAENSTTAGVNVPIGRSIHPVRWWVTEPDEGAIGRSRAEGRCGRFPLHTAG